MVRKYTGGALGAGDKIIVRVEGSCDVYGFPTHPESLSFTIRDRILRAPDDQRARGALRSASSRNTPVRVSQVGDYVEVKGWLCLMVSGRLSHEAKRGLAPLPREDHSVRQTLSRSATGDRAHD